MKILPSTRTGKWSAWLGLGALLTMLLLFLLAEVLSFLQNKAPILVLGIITAIVAFIAGAVVGLVAVIKHKERSIAVLLSIACGLFVIVFLLFSRFGPQG